MSIRVAAFTMISGLLIANADPASAQIKRFGIDEPLGLSKAVVVPAGNLAFTSQISPRDPAGKSIGAGDAAMQTQAVLGFLESILEKELHATPSDVAKINVYATSDAVVPIVQREIAKSFLKEHLPAVSYVITPLRVAEAQVAIDAVVKQNHTGPAPLAKGTVRRQAIAGVADADGKKPAIGRYGMPADRAGDSVSIWGNQLILVSGQAEPGEFRESVGKTWKSLVKTVEWAGGSIDTIGQVKVFMNSIEDAQVVIDEIAKISYIAEPDEVLPAFSFVQWTNKGATEIEVIAAQLKEIDKNADPVRHLTPPWMSESPVYCKVAVTNSEKLIFTSGLYGTPGADGETQVNSMFTELDKIMKECGSDLKHLAKATYYVANDDVSGKLTTLRPKYYDPKHPPAASKASVIGVGMEKCTITLDMIAVPTAK